MKKTIIDRLQKLQVKMADKFPDINSGGCCVAAAHVAYQLKYRHNIPVCVRVECWGEDEMGDIDVARSNVENTALATTHDWNSNGIRFWHVIAEFEHNGNTYHFDSKGLAKVAFLECGGTISELSGISENVLYKGALTVEEALVLASKQDGWNPCFDRKDIPKLMNLISAQLR